MKPILPLVVAFCLLGAGCHPAADRVGLYLQLVCGNDQDTPPRPDAKPAGPALDGRLHSVFRWKHYWELKRDAVHLKEGQRARRRLSAEREVEIELLPSQNMAVRIYENGKLTRSRKQPLNAAFFVAGGNRGARESWFIVVRRDPPLDLAKD